MNDRHLAIRLPNWLGDVVMALPSLSSLTQAGYTFDLFGKPWIKDLFSGYTFKTHPVPSTFMQARRLFQTSPASRSLLLTNGLSSALHVAYSGKPSFGYRGRGRQMFLNHSKTKSPGLHEIEYFWDLTQFSVPTPLPKPQSPLLVIADKYIQQADTLLEQHNIQAGFFVICPGAIGHGANKQSKVWPYWESLAANLVQHGIKLVACPAPFETAHFEQAFSKYATILTDVNLPLYAAVMKRAKQVIANDSGPMHMAAAVQAPVLGVFGETDPQRCHPWGGQYIGKLGAWPTCDDVLETLEFEMVSSLV